MAFYRVIVFGTQNRLNMILLALAALVVFGLIGMSFLYMLPLILPVILAAFGAFVDLFPKHPTVAKISAKVPHFKFVYLIGSGLLSWFLVSTWLGLGLYIIAYFGAAYLFTRDKGVRA